MRSCGSGKNVHQPRYSILFGGDFNEDVFSGAARSSTPDCDLITSADVQAKFASIGMDVASACAAGLIGTPTWDPLTNDLAYEFTSTKEAVEVLDLLIQHSSSAPSPTPPPAAAGDDVLLKNVVSTLKTEEAWAGTFCDVTSGLEWARVLCCCHWGAGPQFVICTQI